MGPVFILAREQNFTLMHTVCLSPVRDSELALALSVPQKE